ncbi:MAG: MFS transporter [Candidatus Berkiella sp.]
MPFILSLALTLANALILFSFLPKKIDKVQKENESKQMNYIKVLAKGFAICFDKRINLLSLSVFVLQWCLAGFFQLSTLLLAEKFNYSSGEIGMFTTFLGACFSGGLFFVIHVLLGRISYLSLLRTGAILLICSVLSAIYFQETSLVAWISVVPMMLGISMMYNVLLVLMSNAVSAQEQGEVMGGGTALKGLAWLSSGLVISIFYPNAIAILVCMMILACIALLSTMKIKITFA